jgi:hypothetical protein
MMARLLSLLPAASGARGATAASATCGGFGFALNAAATYDFAPASHEVPSPPRFLVLNSRPLGIVVWHRNIKNRLIGCQAWVGLDFVWRIHRRKAGVLLPRCDPLSIFSPGFAERSSQKSS